MISNSWVFIVMFIRVKVSCDWHEVKTVMEGEDLNLPIRNTEPKSLDEVMWQFESIDQTFRIAQMYQGFQPFYDERLTGRVKMDELTGSLTIYNISTNESGLYTAKLTIKGLISRRKIKVDVYAQVSTPAISNSFPISNQSQDTSQKMQEFCSVLCSVKNDHNISISWYKGSEMVNQTSSSDLRFNLTLPLKLYYNDTETYRCTAANPVSNKSINLQMKDLCPHFEGNNRTSVRFFFSYHSNLCTTSIFKLTNHLLTVCMCLLF
ncbi:CD48 antigen [Misgurnus anguillicaudatus]|uniref:CD48 antigen n=1 Tax=Misgurnus anguillicaudatus TaxID=75329 RepID=UPI003CCF4331